MEKCAQNDLTKTYYYYVFTNCIIVIFNIIYYITL